MELFRQLDDKQTICFPKIPKKSDKINVFKMTTHCIGGCSYCGGGQLDTHGTFGSIRSIYKNTDKNTDSSNFNKVNEVPEIFSLNFT